MLDKKQIQVISLFEFKMGPKTWRQLTTSTTHLAQELLMNIQWSGSSRYSAKETRVLKNENIVASHWKLTTTNRESSKLILLQLSEKLLKNSMPHILWSFGIWSKLERWKSLVNGFLMSWPKFKILLFWSVVFSYSMQQTTMNDFLIRL